MSPKARALLDAAGDRPYFDYVKGRVMKINLAQDELFTGLYSRDNGDLAAEKVLQPLLERAEGKV